MLKPGRASVFYMQPIDFDDHLDKLVQQNPRYHRDAYIFLKEALEFTQKLLLNSRIEPTRHISGKELLEGIRQYALEQFGPMSGTVFEQWGVLACEDFGEMVFLMVDFNLLRKTDADSREDFKGAYNFEDAFRKPFLPRKVNPEANPSHRGLEPKTETREFGH